MKMFYKKADEKIIQYYANQYKQEITEKLNPAMQVWNPEIPYDAFSIKPVGKLMRKDIMNAAIWGLKEINPRCKICFV